MLKSAQTRDPVATRRRILTAARAEYARYGLDGARVDRIAARAKTNKRMLYHYFGNKDDLYRQTLEDAYTAFRQSEAELHIENDDPVTAIRRLVAFTWNYYLENPEFLTIVNTENLHKAAYLRKSKRIDTLSKPFIGRMRELLMRGASDGVFRRNLDPVHVLITVAAIGYHYLNNRHTGSIIYGREMMARAELNRRLAFNIDTVLRIVCTPKTLLALEAQA